VLLFALAGHSRVRFRTESAAAAASEAPDPAASACRRAHPVAVAMLRGRHQLAIGRHVETAHETGHGTHVRRSVRTARIACGFSGDYRLRYDGSRPPQNPTK